jgi:hypothetical protein
MRTVLVASALALVSSGPAMAAAPPSPPAAGTQQASVSAAGGVVVVYPENWRAVVTGAGTVIGIAGPTAGGGRPAASILVARGGEDMRSLMASAARGVERTGKARLLGEQHLGAFRWARYYLRGDDRAAEYVVLGVAEGGGWIATVVAVDAASDPDLRVRAAIFQRMLADLEMPG